MEDFKEFYPDASEAHPRKKLEPLGGSVTVWVFVDDNHEGNLENRRSHSGILIYVNNTLINFHSKRQNTFESSSFGSGLVALRIATDMVESLRYKLRTFDINLEGPEEVYCDKNSVVKNPVYQHES